MTGKFLGCLWTVMFVFTCIAGFSSCDEDDKFKTLIGNWYNSKEGYFCFRNDGSGFVQEYGCTCGYGYGHIDELLKQEHFVYRYDESLCHLIFLQFSEDGRKDTLMLTPIGANEISIDSVTYLRVRNEPEDSDGFDSEIKDNRYE